MAFEKMFMVTIAIIAIVAPSALAKEFVVGDDKGWTVNFDYQTWAAGKDFRVGDKLSTFKSSTLLFVLFIFQYMMTQ